MWAAAVAAMALVLVHLAGAGAGGQSRKAMVDERPTKATRCVPVFWGRGIDRSGEREENFVRATPGMVVDKLLSSKRYEFPPRA